MKLKILKALEDKYYAKISEAEATLIYTLLNQ